MDTETSLPVWIRKAIAYWWGGLVLLWLLLLLARQLRGLLTTLTISLFLSFALEPLVARLEKRGMTRGLSTGLSLLVFFIASTVFVAVMGTLLATQLTQLADDMPGYLENGQVWLDDQFNIKVSADDLIKYFEDGGAGSRYLTDLAGNLVGLGTTVASVLFQVLTITLFTFYLAADGPRLRRFICSYLPPERQRNVLTVWEVAIQKTGAYISSRLVLALISTLFHWMVFQLLGLPSPIALAIWVGIVSQFIPTLGTYLAGILPILVAIGVDPRKALWVLFAIVIYQQIENYVLQPRLTAQTLDMHPAVAIAAVLAGTSLFGIAGALLALPVVATASGFLSAYFDRHDVVEDLPSATKA